MPRVALVKPRSLMAYVATWISKRMLGKVPTSLRILFGHPRVLATYVNMERGQQAARKVEASIKALAQIRVATRIGCPF